MLAALGLLVWAGMYNFESRKQAMEHARAAHMELTPDSTDSGSLVDAPGMGNDLRGKQAPTFSLETVDGAKFSSKTLAGHPMIVNFWATYCGPCKLEMPWFQEFSKKYAAQGLDVVGIDDEDGVTKQQVKAAAQKIGVTYPILIADSAVEKSFGLGDYLPETYYIDAQGKVLAQTPGAPSKDEVEANIRKILAPVSGAM